MGVGRKLQSIFLILHHTSDFSIPDILIDLSDLHHHKIPQPDLRLVLLCLISFLCNCDKWVISWLAWGLEIAVAII